jgi:hypothetical protein
MKAKKSTLKKRRVIRYVEIAVVVLLVAALVAVAIVMYNTRPNASDYFAFSDVGAEYESLIGNTIQTIKIQRLNFTVTPVGGNATNFHIDPYPGDNTDPIDYYYSEIKNGTKQTIEVTLNNPVQSIKNGTTYPFTIFVYCDEAKGNVTLQIRLKASDYFAFSELGAEYESINGTENIVKIRTLHFAVTPVGGNATEFHIDPGGHTDPVEYYYPIIENGTSQAIDVQLAEAVLCTKNGTTFPFELFVYCAEAEGDVTLQIPQENMFEY